MRELTNNYLCIFQKAFPAWWTAEAWPQRLSVLGVGTQFGVTWHTNVFYRVGCSLICFFCFFFKNPGKPLSAASTVCWCERRLPVFFGRVEPLTVQKDAIVWPAGAAKVGCKKTIQNTVIMTTLQYNMVNMEKSILFVQLPASSNFWFVLIDSKKKY